MESSRETESLRVRIWALAQALKSHGYALEVAESEPALTVPAAFGPPVVLLCDLRAVCVGEPWYFFAGGGPIAPATDGHMQDVVVAVKGRLASQAHA